MLGMNKPSDLRVREAVETIFNIQPNDPGLAHIDANLKSRNLLHQWPLSRVERLEFRNGELPNLIFKAVINPLKSELAVYQDIFPDNNRWTATLFGHLELGDELWMFFEDVGSRTLKSEPSFDNLIRATATLASLHVTFGREVSSGELQRRSHLRIMDYAAYVESARDTYNLTEMLVKRGKYSSVDARKLSKLDSVVNSYNRVAISLQGSPQTLVHGDFDAENIAFHQLDDHVVLLDWADAFIGTGLIDLVDLTNFAYPIFGPDIMPRLLQTYRQAYRAASGEAVAAEPLEEMFVCSQIEKKMSLIRWFNMCSLRYIPSGVAAYNNSVAGLIDDTYELSTILR